MRIGERKRGAQAARRANEAEAEGMCVRTIDHLELAACHEGLDERLHLGRRLRVPALEEGLRSEEGLGRAFAREIVRCCAAAAAHKLEGGRGTSSVPEVHSHLLDVDELAVGVPCKLLDDAVQDVLHGRALQVERRL